MSRQAVAGIQGPTSGSGTQRESHAEGAMEQFHGTYYLRFVFPVLLLLILVESVFYKLKFRKSYPWKESASSLGVAIGHQVTGYINQFVIIGLLGGFVWEHRLFTVPEGTWWYYPLLFLGTEFSYYWYHRASHEIRWGWAVHSTHHSPNELTLSAAYRLNWTPILSFSWAFYLAWIWVGYTPAAVFGIVAINLIYQFWLHTRLIPKLGPLEWVFNTPSSHRVHHASNPEYLDKNYGGVVILYDRLFGTYVNEKPGVEIRYGLTHPLTTLN